MSASTPNSSSSNNSQETMPSPPTTPSDNHSPADDAALPPAPEVHVNGKPASAQAHASAKGNGGWGSNFWVTLVDPQNGTSFYACPATGEVSWDPPVGNFLLPPSPDGEWWEMFDESSGLPYYYHTKSGETVWERPDAFVIPLGILQNTALGRRLSLNRMSQSGLTAAHPGYRRSKSYTNDKDAPRSSQAGDRPEIKRHPSQSSTRSTPARGSHANPGSSVSPHSSKKQLRKSTSSEQYRPTSNLSAAHASPLSYQRGHALSPIPGSPYNTDASPPATPSRKSMSATPVGERSSPRHDKAKGKETSPGRKSTTNEPHDAHRSRAKAANFVPYRAPQPQSLNAAVEIIALSSSHSSHNANNSKSSQETRPSEQERCHLSSAPPLPESPPSPARLRLSTDPGVPRNGITTPPASPTKVKSKGFFKAFGVPPSPDRRVPASPTRSASFPVSLRGKEIGNPVVNHEALSNMSPVKLKNAGKPIPVPHVPADEIDLALRRRTSTLNTGAYPVLPDDLASDIQQFSESQFAKQYFSTHRTGFIFRRTVPVAQMMTWQKNPLSSPLLQANRNLQKEAIKVFKSIQRVMGDRERERPSHNGSTTSLHSYPSSALLEEERWLLGEGLAHGELRDEIYCQVMKQLNGNPSAESVFKGWQLLCVLLVTFPPSKNFETSLRSYMQQATSQQEGRVDVMAKYCLRRLAYISRKGPRGKAPTLPEIEAAADAAFHPSIFSESLDMIYRLQERNYPHLKVPIILPFLADGILALGGTKTEGIFRIPGDGDSVSELKLRIDKGYYTLDGFDDPNVLASLFKLWLRELCDPLVPEEMYNECIMHASDPEMCVSLVQRLPTINRRVVLFVVSFLQLFLEEKIQVVTKMTSPNLALVMAPNLLRCNSESMAVVFTNAQFEQTFVHNLLLYLKCSEIDPDYVPSHGHGAVPPSPDPPRKSKSKQRRPLY